MSSISSIGSGMEYSMMAMQRPKPQEMFKKVDSDGSGGVSQTELQTLTDRISEKSGQSLDAAQLLTTYDSNSDGSLGQDEMNSLMESIRPKHEREAMLNGEATTDSQSSQSGSLDTQSMASYLSNSGQELVTSLISMLQQLQSTLTENAESSDTVSEVNSMAGGRARPQPPNPEELFKTVDTDGSGSVAQDELQTLLDKLSEKNGQTLDAKELLAQNDQDGNGTLSEEEMGSMMKSIAPPPPPTLQAQSESTATTTDETVQNALSSFLQSTDKNNLASLLKLMKSYAGNSTTGQTVSTMS